MLKSAICSSPQNSRIYHGHHVIHFCENACGLWTPETCSKPRQLFIQTDVHGLTSFLYIDESFILLTGLKGDLETFGKKIQADVLKKTGLPTGIGIGPNRTLAKLANFAAKRWKQKTGSVVSLLDPPDRLEKLLRYTDVGSVWGIGSRLSARLNACNITKAWDLSRADPAQIRRDFSITLERTVRELRGEYQFAFGEVAGPQAMIACTRSFGQRVYDKSTLAKALATYTARVAVKLRKQGSRAEVITVFICSSPFDTRGPRYSKSSQAVFVRPTSDSRELIQAVIQQLDHIYRPGVAFARAGVICTKLSMEIGYIDDLFAPPLPERSEKLMQSIDRINGLLGKDTVRFGGTAADRYWGMKREFISPRFTTSWSELPLV
ncbi:DNA polymerase V [Pseudomonas baetica]|nr:DNA polymerase V [Pseudomonas baetica]